MARPKEFDRDAALKAAIAVFCDYGYEGTSTEALVEAMGIGRQSLYNTFGDKRRLYLEALQRYNADGVARVIRDLGGAPSPLQGVEAALVAFASRPAREAALGCMGVGAICEIGRSDPEVTLLTETANRTLQSALERLLAEAQEAGEIGADLDLRTAALFIGTTIVGMKVAARGGASADALRAIARLAVRNLR